MAAISVIVPVYKVEPYLHRCVDSILAQTYSDYELILVDDGSPDNCGTICDEYAAKDSRVHVIHQKNSGVSAARNVGLARAFANGCQWVAFVDSDDWIHSRFLEVLHRAAVENAVLFSYCGFCYVQEGEAVSENTLPDALHVNVHSPEDVFYSRNDGIVMSYVCRCLFHIRLLLGIRFPEGRLWEDAYIFPEIIFRTERVAEVDAKLYYYLQRKGSAVHSNWSIAKLDELYSFEHCLRVCEQLASKSLCALIAGDYIRRIHDQYYSVIFSACTKKEKEQILHDLRNSLNEEMKRYGGKLSLPKRTSTEIFYMLHPPMYDLYLNVDKIRAIMHDRIQMLMDR